MTPQSPKYAHQSRFVRSHTLNGIRVIHAEEMRIRRLAERFGLKAKHHRIVGGWSLICQETGGVVVSRTFAWDADEYLKKVKRDPNTRTALQCLVDLMKLNKMLAEHVNSEGWL